MVIETAATISSRFSQIDRGNVPSSYQGQRPLCVSGSEEHHVAFPTGSVQAGDVREQSLPDIRNST